MCTALHCECQVAGSAGTTQHGTEQRALQAARAFDNDTVIGLQGGVATPEIVPSVPRAYRYKGQLQLSNTELGHEEED